MHRQRRIRARMAALAAAALPGLLLAGCAGGTSVTPEAAVQPGAGRPVIVARTVVTRLATLSAPALLQAAQAAVRAGGDVRAEVRYTGGLTAEYADDATGSSGRQVITFGQGGRVTVLLMSHVGYVQGNALGLQDFCGVPAARAERFAGKWIAVRPGQTLGTGTYAQVTSGITLPSLAAEFALSGTPVLVKPTTLAGQRVDGLRGYTAAGSGLPQPAAVTLLVAHTAQRRPVLLRVLGSSYSYQLTFTKWHEELHLSAPVGAVPATEVSG